MAEVLETVVSWILAGMILALVLLLLAIPVLWALNIILTPLAPFIERWAERSTERWAQRMERWTERMERGTERSTERWAERTKRTEEWFDRVEEWFERAKEWLDRAEKSRARRRDSNSDG